MASILEEEKLEQEILDTIDNSELSKSEVFKQTKEGLDKEQQINDELVKNQERQKELEKELLDKEQNQQNEQNQNKEQNEQESISLIDENTHQEKSIPLNEFKESKNLMIMPLAR